MKIEQKPPEQIQAQIAAFAQEEVKDTGYWRGNERDEIFRNIGDLAAGEAVDHAYAVVRKDILNSTKINEKSYTLSAQSYVDYLQSKGGGRNEAIENRKAYLEA